jgi:hypothetical protein
MPARTWPNIIGRNGHERASLSIALASGFSAHQESRAVTVSHRHAPEGGHWSDVLRVSKTASREQIEDAFR